MVLRFRLAIRTDPGRRIVRAWSIVPAAVDERQIGADLVTGDAAAIDALLQDKGFTGTRFGAEMAHTVIEVIIPPTQAQRQTTPQTLQRLIARLRNRVETSFKEITGQMELARHGALTFEGLLTRTAAVLAARTLLLTGLNHAKSASTSTHMTRLSYAGVQARPPSAVCQVAPAATSQPRVASVKAGWMLAAEPAGSSSRTWARCQVRPPSVVRYSVTVPPGPGPEIPQVNPVRGPVSWMPLPTGTLSGTRAVPRVATISIWTPAVATASQPVHPAYPPASPGARPPADPGA